MFTGIVEEVGSIINPGNRLRLNVKKYYQT